LFAILLIAADIHQPSGHFKKAILWVLVVMFVGQTNILEKHGTRANQPSQTQLPVHARIERTAHNQAKDSRTQNVQNKFRIPIFSLFFALLTIQVKTHVVHFLSSCLVPWSTVYRFQIVNFMFSIDVYSLIKKAFKERLLT
jgi:hypothetical protein